MERKLNELALVFFRRFARLEYALKVAGFHNGDGPAEPNWRTFAESVSGHFEDIRDQHLQAAVDYILEYPPKKQVIKDGFLDWDESIPQTDLRADLVLIYVRRVRNNLFHGGKFNGRWFEPQRSEQLLEHSITILKACLHSSPPVRDAYNH